MHLERELRAGKGRGTLQRRVCQYLLTETNKGTRTSPNPLDFSVRARCSTSDFCATKVFSIPSRSPLDASWLCLRSDDCASEKRDLQTNLAHALDPGPCFAEIVPDACCNGTDMLERKALERVDFVRALRVGERGHLCGNDKHEE